MFIPGSTNLHQESIIVIDKSMEFVFILSKLTTGKETALALTPDSMLLKLDKQDIKNVAYGCFCSTWSSNHSV